MSPTLHARCASRRASRLFLQPSSTLTQHQHRRQTRITLQNKQPYPAPPNWEETQSWHGVGVEFSGSLPPQSVTGGDREREGTKPGADERESDRKTPLPPNHSFGGLAAVRPICCGGLCFILETARYVSLPVHYLRHSPDPQRAKASLYRGYFFSIANGTRLFTAISRCPWPQIQQFRKLLRNVSALAKQKYGSLS